MSPAELSRLKSIINNHSRELDQDKEFEYSLVEDAPEISLKIIFWQVALGATISSAAYTIVYALAIMNAAATQLKADKPNYWSDVFWIAAIAGTVNGLGKYWLMSVNRKLKIDLDRLSMADLYVSKGLEYPTRHGYSEPIEYSELLHQVANINNAQLEEIPDEFLCRISLQIATTPVYIVDRKTGVKIGNVIYDLKNLRKWITQSDKLPCPSIPFCENRHAIVDALNISKRIDLFLLKQLNAFEKMAEESEPSSTPVSNRR